MYLKEIIKTLKTPFQFNPDSVIEKRDIIKILEAARWAPSAENEQAWRFLVVDDKNKKELVVHSIEEQDPRLTTTLQDVKKPILNNRFVFSTRNFNAVKDKYKEFILESHSNDVVCAKSASLFIICTHSLKFAAKAYGWTDMGAAIVNVLIIANELGFGTRWIRNFNRESIQEKLEIQKSLVIDAILAIGKPTKESDNNEIENKKYEDFYFYNQWGSILKTKNFKIKKSKFQNYDVEAVDTILDRRSVRRFIENKEIPKRIISELVKAGMMVPLIINKPYLKIILVDDKKILNQIANNAKLVLKKQKHVQKVPLIVAITYDCTNNSPGFYAEIDTGAIIQAIILRAHSLGIGSCWIGAFSRKNVRKILNIEEDWHLPSMAILGYPKKYPKPTPRVSLGKIGYYNVWESGIEKKYRSFLPSKHFMSVPIRKIKKTRIETPLRKRKVGELKGIPEFEKLKKSKKE